MCKNYRGLLLSQTERNSFDVRKRWCWQSFTMSAANARQLLVLIVAVLIPSMTSSQLRKTACPNVCVCNLAEVRCIGSQLGLTAVPIGITRNISNLAITQTGITRIERTDFKGLEELKILYLQDNNINFIDPLALRNMYKLELVNLERNRLTSLDPTGLMFQHMPSLTLIDMQMNSITSLNRFSFLTAVAKPNTNLSVRLYQNPVQCNCDVLAMRTWMDILPNDRLILADLVCQNDARQRTYDKVPKTLFGNCQVRACIAKGIGNNTKNNAIDQNPNGIKNNNSTNGNIKRPSVENDNSIEKGEQTEETDLFLQGNPFGTTPTTTNPLFAHEDDAKGLPTSSSRTTTERGYQSDPRNHGNSNSNSNEKKCRNLIAIQNSAQIRGVGNQNEQRPFDSDDEEICEENDEESAEDIADKPTPNGCGADEDIFSTMFKCPVCEKERTNYACNLKPHQTCTGLEMVCLRTVTWNQANHTLLVTSRCESYISCLSRENRNSDRCGVGYQSNGDVRCEFCCLGPTCHNDSIGGRTFDQTFYLSYVKGTGPYESYMGDASSTLYRNEMERITTGVRSEIRSVKGGVDVYFISFGAHSSTQHKVTLRIEITALTSETEGSILSTLEQDIGISVGTRNGFLFSEQAVMNSVLLRRNFTGELFCQEETTNSDKGTMIWGRTKAGSTLMVACPLQNSGSGKQAYAKRACVISLNGDVASWGLVEDGNCPNTGTANTLDDLLNETVNSDNVQKISSAVEELTSTISSEEDGSKQWATETVDKTVTALEIFVQPEYLDKEGVASNVVQTVSNLLDIDQDIMREAEEEKQTSQRILSLIDIVSETGPLVGGKLKIVAPNVVVAAQRVGPSETRDLTLQAHTADGAERRLEDNQVSLDFSARNKNPSTDTTNLVLPIAAIVRSMTSEEKRKLERASFAVHRSDKLFSKIKAEALKTMQESSSYPTLMENGEVSMKISDGSSGNTAKARYVTEVNSFILSASMPGVKIDNLSENVTMTFEHNTTTNATNPRCVFWDELTNDWSSAGCGVVISLPEATQCGCDHLTNFALLMDIYQEGTGLSSLDRKVLSFISYVGVGVSLGALLLTLLTYSLFRKLHRDNPSKILINLCLALLFSNLVYLVGMHDYAFDNSTVCKIVAVLLHYCLLASLTWMAVEAFYMYLALIVVFKTYFTRFILKCAIIGWGIPLVIVIVTLAIDSTDNYGFINSGITLQRLRGAIGVVSLLGLTWIFAVFAIGEASVVFYYLFAIFNSLQGLFIFVFYCLLKKDAVIAWKRVLVCFEEYGESSKSSSNSRAASNAGTNQNVVSVKFKPKSSTQHGTTSSRETTSTALPDSRKASVITMLDSGNMYHTIEDGDVYTTLDNEQTHHTPSAPSTESSHPQGPPSYSDAHVSANPSMQQYPYTDKEPSNRYRDGSISSSSSTSSPTALFRPGSQPFAAPFSYPERYYQQQPSSPRKTSGGGGGVGEIDSTNIAKVGDIRLRFERTLSNNSNKYGSNI
ncbi:G-protein coupled receptor 126-like [Plakobranchus ocellatus]|uniref:G-protein coupled receptor 126-like n=1 Tax=Plakobranchus ocellatus TaxID=259542 RepID=A0AAV4C7L1_9GAST|nr:G-protein coupled receptor 126-like [Plakobranchus ocellatus]